MSKPAIKDVVVEYHPTAAAKLPGIRSVTELINTTFDITEATIERTNKDEKAIFSIVADNPNKFRTTSMTLIKQIKEFQPHLKMGKRVRVTLKKIGTNLTFQ